MFVPSDLEDPFRSNYVFSSLEIGTSHLISGGGGLHLVEKGVRNFFLVIYSGVGNK